MPGGFNASGLANYENGLNAGTVADKVKDRQQQYRDTCGKCGARRIDAQIGLEATPEEYIANMVGVFREVWRVLADDGTLWVNMGDSYAANGISGLGTTEGHGRFNGGAKNDSRVRERTVPPGLKPKDLCGIPWRLAFALQADGWYLRSDIIWHKPNPMPESVTDRPTKAHEYLFLLSKRAKYFYDADSVREPAQYGRRDWGGSDQHAAYTRSAANLAKRGDRKTPESYTQGADPSAGRNRRTVWTIATAPFKGAHFATFPPKLVEPCILAGTSEVGHCPQCNARHVRVVEKRLIKQYETRHGGFNARGTAAGMVDMSKTWSPGTNEVHTLGFRPTCAHNLKPVPDVALDIFAGSGTTGLVAEQLGRRFIGIELNPEYSKLAREAA